MSFDGDATAAGEGLSSRTVLVESTGQVFVSAGSEDGCSDGGMMLVLPVDALGTEYYASSWNPKEVNGIAKLEVIATKDDTQITIESASATKIVRTINKAFESFIYQSEFDITGAHITANHPVAVISGSSQMILDRTVDHFSYLHPVELWGSQFVVPGVLSEREYAVKIVAASPNTEVNIAGVGEFTLSTGEFLNYRVTSKDHIFIDATAPLQVVQYLMQRFGGSEAVYTSTLVPSVVRYASDYFFIVPDFGGSLVNLAFVIVETSQTTGLQFDAVFGVWEPVENSYPPLSVGSFFVSFI